MTILYVGVADDSSQCVVVEAAADAAAAGVALRVLQTKPHQASGGGGGGGGIRAYRIGTVKAFVRRCGGYTLVCVGDSEADEALAPMVLGDLAAIVTSPAGTWQRLASEALAKFGDAAAAAAGEAKFHRLRDDLSKLRDSAVENVGLLLERGEKIDVLVERTASLGTSTNHFKRAATTLRRQLAWRDVQGSGVVVAVALVVVALVYWTVAAA